MNTPDYHLRRAHTRLHEAEVLMASDVPPEGAANRLYYAAREATLAILANLGSDTDTTPRTHRGLRAMFHENVVLAGLMDPEWSGELANLEERRTQADYGYYRKREIGANIHEQHRTVVRFLEIVRELFVPDVAPFESRLDRNSPDMELGD